MKIYGLILACLIIGMISCDKETTEPNYASLLTNDSTKVWRLDSVTFNALSGSMIEVDICAVDDKYTFKSNNILTYDNNGTKFSVLSPWRGDCMEATIVSDKNWELEDNLLKIGDKTFEIFKINHSQMTLRNYVGGLPTASQDPKPIYEYEVYSAVE